MACCMNYVCFFFCPFAFIVFFLHFFLSLTPKRTVLLQYIVYKFIWKVHNCLQQRVKASIISVKCILIRSDEHIKEFEEVNFKTTVIFLVGAITQLTKICTMNVLLMFPLNYENIVSLDVHIFVLIFLKVSYKILLI